jgi:hypothetical protein
LVLRYAEGSPLSEKTNLNIIEKSIHEGRDISFLFGSLIEDSEEELKTILSKILSFYHQEELFHTTYICTKELLENGLKANVKRIYFQEKGLNIQNEKDYVSGMFGFREILSKKTFEQYLKKTKTSGLYVIIIFKHDRNKLIIEVKNNVELTDIEVRRIKKKLEKADKYNNLAQYYIEESDEIEGSGLGLTLIVLMLKDQQLSKNNFRIKNLKPNTTVAILELPFTK